MRYTGYRQIAPRHYQAQALPTAIAAKDITDIMRLLHWSVLFMTLVMLVLTLMPTTSLAQTTQTPQARTLILNNLYQEHFLSPYLQRYSDPEQNLTLPDLIAGNNLPAANPVLSGRIIPFELSDKTVWLRFSVMNRSKQIKWHIDFGDSLMGRYGLVENIEAHIFNAETNEHKKYALQQSSYIPLTLAPNQKSYVIVRMDIPQFAPLTIPLRIIADGEPLSHTISLHHIIIVTLLIGLGFFFAAISLTQGNYQYLSFTLYYGFLCILFIIQNYFVTLDALILQSYVIPFLSTLVSFSALLIGYLFWRLEENGKILAHLLFYGLITLGAASFLLGLYLPIDASPLVKTTLFYGPSILILVLIPFISINLFQHGSPEAVPFLCGWGVIIFGLGITALSLVGIIQPVSIALNAFWITLIPQAVFFIISTKLKIDQSKPYNMMSNTLEIDEQSSVSRLRETKENTEQARLLKVIEQERRVLGELRKSEARRTAEMRKAKENADEANRAKSAFLAVVSHEIRTPMTGIMGMVRLLLESNLTKEQKEYAQTIQDSSDAMLALLNDILDFEKIERGKMLFENISFDLHRLIQGAATLMNAHAKQKGIELRTKIGNDLPKFVKGDPTRLRQVLLNLTGNAIKFTDDGHVTITAELIHHKGQEDEYEIYFGVTDSGIGISEDAQKKLFSAFSQADASTTRKYGGTGLGLAISRGLVEGMGSEININSNEGEGSTFFFTLNMEKGHGGESNYVEKQSRTEKEIKPLHILVVDDNEVNQRVIAGFLNKFPYDLDMSMTAEDAIEKATQKAQDRPYDLILMDIELPGINGDEATRQIRNINNPSISNTPIIALTGNVQDDHVTQYKQAGMDDIVAKPIDPKDLSQKILSATQNNTNIHQGTTTTQPPSAPETKTQEEPTADNAATKASQQQETVPEQTTQEKNQQQPKPKKKPIIVQNQSVNVVQRVSKQESTTPSDITIFDPDTLDTLKGHLSPEDIQAMLDDVINKSDEIIKDMGDLLAQEDAKGLSAKGHELKGMAGNFGLKALSHQGSLIESKAKTEPPVALTALIEPLHALKEESKKALDQWLDPSASS